MDGKRAKSAFPDDTGLLKGCLARDKQAWDTFVERYGRLIYNAIIQTLNRYSFAIENHVVNDLFQTVFLSLIENNHRKLRQFQWRCRLSGWLHIIAVRMTLDYLRRHQELPSINGETREEIWLREGAANGNPLPDRLAEMKEEERIFEQIKENLNTRERFFIELHYSLELSPAEIARILKITPNNVYQIKSRVRDKMRKIVKKL